MSVGVCQKFRGLFSSKAVYCLCERDSIRRRKRVQLRKSKTLLAINILFSLSKKQREEFLSASSTFLDTTYAMKELVFESVGRLDLAVWCFVTLFFCGSAALFQGDIPKAFLGSAGIIVNMLFISVSIEIIIETLKETKGIGTITGFITNGPEAVCLIVGLVAGDIIFASSTPLGSNFMNPILLLLAAGVSRTLPQLCRTNRKYALTAILATAVLAFIFYALQANWYLFWLFCSILVTVILFALRPAEPEQDESQYSVSKQSKFWLIPAVLLLVISGYFLDPVVSFAAEYSHAPKGVIGFIVLSTLTSWPEFKSSLSLLRKSRPASAILNITVSNITNIWLATAGIAFFLATR